MDVTPQLLQDIEFREKVRGYHPDDVDDFLERVGVAFSELVDRLRQANDRADAAEAARSERAEVDETTLSRTLVLAQRTADAAIAEAKAEAELMRSEARTESEQTVSEAKREAEQMVAAAQGERDALLRNAESDARQQAAAVIGPIEAEIARLETRRDSIVEQSGGLEDWLAAQRVKLESVATDLQEILDDPDRLRADPAPEVDPQPESDSSAEERAAAPLTLVESDDDGHADDTPDGEIHHEAESRVDQAQEDQHAPSDNAAASPTEAETAPSEGQDHDRPDSDETADRRPDLDPAPTMDREDDEAAVPEAPVVDLAAAESDALEDRPSRVSVVRSSLQQDRDETADVPTDEPTGSDSFLEELRRAVEAPTDLVESDEDRALSAFFEHEEEEPKRRFGRRR